ncbi:MAG: hypothetical protein ED859_11045 [Desulfuromonadales bacterium]|nr:MAG: hypothetical protein ED859_11045 [Desulfuromonadales bacterium]
MGQIIRLMFAAALFYSVVPAMAADDTIRTCALTKAFECTSQDGCTEWTVQEMALPRFIQIDLKAKTITSLDKDVPRPPTKIAGIDKLEGMIALHGSEMRSWSLALGETSGALTLSATGDDEAFVVFGSCMNP